ncbi:uncharacterized protein PF11_0213 isoform X3 [Chenopodium quinoa]|uniref:uncharacterized protein PF11_0213 isoform X3 n=1 Tax=Chenopodium quinoa TaxID=63459 RepID=UPI000B785E30|nr:uncharacterized protein PF11_0213 isoform X3 [Chenopodium quinoa]
MTSEADIPESLNMQARDEEDIDKTDKQCILNTDNHPKEHATIENVLQAHYKQTTGTNDEEERKTNITVGNGSSEYTEGESFMYPPTVEKVAYEDTVRQSKDFTEAILDDAITTISKTKIQQDSKKLATAEDADELPTGRPGLDEKGRETSDSMKIANQEPKSGHHNEEKESDIKTDNDAYNENQDKLNLHEIKTVELPVCVFEQLEGLKIDLKSEDLEKTFTEAVKGPRTMTQKDEEEKVDSTGLADISVLHTFSSPTDSNKESISETIKDMKELGVSSWENINTVGEKKGVNEVGNNNNLEEVEDTSRSNIMLTEITDAEGENFESNTNSHRDKIHPDEGDQNEQDTFISETDSGNSVKGPPESAMEIPEKCTVEAAMRQEGLETEILEEVLKLSSEYIEAGETTDDVTYSEHGETKSDIVSSEDQRNENHTVGAGNCHASKISQDNEDDLLFSNNTEAIDRGDEKKNLYTESQQEQENQKIELSKEESFPKDQASEVNKTKEFTHSEVNSDEDMKKNGADFTTSVTKEEMMQEFMESDPEKRLEVQNEKESTEAKTKGQASDNHLQERKIASAGDAEEETICKYDSTSVNISPEQSAERTDQSSFEVKEAEISREKKQCIDLDDFQSKNPTTEQDQNGSTLLEEYTYDVIMQDSTDRSMDDSFPKEKLQNQISDENHSEKAETNQEIIENSPRQDEVTEILNDSMKFIEADATIDKQHENLEDEDIYNLIKSVLTEKDIKAELGIIEVQMDKNTYAQICSDEIHEEKTVAKKEIVNQSSKESNSCSEKQGQEIAEACTQVLRNDEWKRIACEDIQVNEVEEEAAIDKQKCSKETEDQTTNGDSTDMVDGVDFKQENENLISMVEDMNQVTNAESDNLNVLEDKLHEQTGYNPDHKTEVDNNVEYVNQSSGEGNSCNEKQDQQKAKASTPHIEAEFAISRKGECTRVSSEEVQVIEIEEEAAIDKQPFTSKTHTIPEVGEEILLANANSKSALEDLNQDKNAQLSSTEIEKDEKENEDNCFSEIHQTKAVNSKEILNQSFEESNSWTETQDKEIAQASTPPPGAEIIQVSEIEKETSIGAIEQQIIENENSMYTLKDVDQNMSTRSIIIEAQTDEQTGSNENNVMGEANNGNTVIQISEVSDHCGGNQDQEVSQGFTHLTKVENLVLSNEEFTSISSEGIQVSEVSEEATIDEQQCMLEITNREKSGVFSYEAKGVEGLLEKENSVSIMEDVIQDLNAQRGSIEVQKTENTNANSSLNDIHELQAVNHDDFLNQNYEQSNSCSEKIDKDTVKAYTPQLKARTFDPSNNECTMMPSDELKVREDDNKTTIQEQQCCAKNEHPNGVCSDEVMRVKNVEGNQNFMNIIKNRDQDMTSESDNTDVLQDENTHNQADSEDINEIEAINNEEIVSQSSKESNSSSGNEDQDFYRTFIPHLEAKNDVQRNDECSSICSEDIQVTEMVVKAAADKKQCTSQDEDPNKTTDVSSNDVTRMEIVQENEISMNKVGDVDQENLSQQIIHDKSAVSDNIEVLQAENTDVQTGTKDIHDTILVNNEEVTDKSSDEKGSYCEKNIQETNDACALQVEVIHHAPTKDECTRICSEEFQVSEVEDKSTIDKNKCSSETDDPNKTKEGVYSHKDMNSQSNDIQKDEKTNEQIFSDEIHETEGFSNQETVNQSFEENNSYSGKKDQKSSPTSTLLLETTDPTSSDDEWTRPPGEEVKVDEVEEEAVIVEQRCNAENGDPNKIKNVVLPIEVGRVEIIQDNENHHNIVEDVDQKGTFQDTDTEADSIEAQRNEKAHKETSLYEIQDTKVVNQKETVNQSSEENTCGEKQDQGTAEASEIRRKDECTRINGEEIQVSDVKEEVADEKLERSFETKNVNKITNGICPSEVKGLEIEQENESSMNIEQDLDKGAVQGKILQPESHEVQQVDQTHMKTCLNNFDETEAVRQHVEIEDQSSKESDFCNDKQDQEIARASKPNIEAEYPVIDKSTMISSSKVEEEETIEIQQCNSEDPNDIKHDVSSYERIEEDNVIESELNQPVGTETSGQNGNIKKDGLDLSQSAKKSNDHTQLIEYNTAAGLESEHHKHENEDPREMTNRFEEEVKHTYESISTNEIDTVSEKVKYVELGASIAGEVSSVQYVLAPEFGISRESIDKEGKQGVDTIKTKGLLERNNMKALEVSSTDEIQHLSVIKEFPHKVEAEEVELIKLTEIDHDFQDKASTELHAKKFFEDQEFDDAKHEEKLSKATISDVNSQDVTEITTDETVQKHNWQASEPLDQLQEPSSKECEQKIESCKTEDRDESTKTMKGQKDEKPNDSSEKTSQETCSLEEEQRELEVSNSDFIPSVVLLKPVVKDVTKDISHKPEPENESSEFQGATSASEYELNSELEMSMYSCSQESKKENECQSLEKSEQTNDISVQYESSPELISERNVVNMCEIASDIQERNEISEHIAKQYDQEWINSEDCNEDKRQKAAKTQLTMGENKSKDSEEYKDPICDTTITEVSSIDDSMKEAYKQLSEKNAFVQVNHLVQNHEILHKVTESNEMNGSNSQEALLQRDMGDDFDISTSVETQKINDRQMFPPNAVEIDILSARDAEEITDVDELERDSSDESSKETKANQFSEKLEQDDAKGENKCQDQMAILMHYQDVIETDVVARHITQANETNEKLQAPVYQNLEETNETTKPVAEIEGKTDDSLSEKQVKEICVPEKEQKELKVLNLKDEPNDDSLSKQELVEIVQTTGDSTMKEPEDLSVELEATTSTAKTETSTEPMNYSEPSSQTIKYKTKVQDLKSTEFHELTKSSQEALERKGEELAKSEKTLQEKDHQTKSNELIAEERSLNNFGAHVAATDVVNYDKIAVLSNDPTLAQQNLQETKSHDNVEKRKMGEEQEMMTEFSNSFVDDGTDAKATRHELLEHKDSEGLNEIQNVRELNILHIEEKEQEQQEKCEKLLDSSQFQDSLSNIPKEASIDDIKRLQADNKEEHNETEVYAQKGLSTIESKRIGVTSNDPAKENSERAVTVDNSSIAKNEYSEQIPENQNKAQINSITLDTTNKQQEIILQRDTNKSREDAALKPKESELKLPLISEGLREIDPKTTQKRSQNLLSGVGSKVKHSISKVKKAIACSSSQFQPEEVIVKLNKNKKN